MANESSGFNVDNLLNDLFKKSLRELFDERIEQLGIVPTNALEIMDIEYRALQNIVDGESTRVDARNFSKLAVFLNISKEEVIRLFYKAVDEKFPDLSNITSDKKIFIGDHFDLATLKKIGFIDDILNYKEIDEKITLYFGLNSILDYKLPTQQIAFSVGLRGHKNILSFGFWINSAQYFLRKLNNPYPYNPQGLKEYFPKIRKKSLDVDQGLIDVISDLYKLGITVFYQTSIPSFHLKGATIVVSDKPCIVLTDYMGYYLTLWHTLCHEISHVLFDFEEIKKEIFHISKDDSDDLDWNEKEKSADNFAKEFLFSSENMSQIKPHINNRKFIIEFAEKNQIHESFLYTYYAYEYGKLDKKAWSRAKLYNPSFERGLKRIENNWLNSTSIDDHVKYLKETNIYI